MAISAQREGKEVVTDISALLDRLLHHAHVLKCGPKSWRLRHHTLPAEGITQ